jgi:uncharacterized membrane protein
MNPGMLLFALFDSGVAFFLVYSVVKAKFGGNEKAIARIMGTILGVIVFIAEFCAIVWFNTEENTVSQAAKNVVYAAPIVLSILIGVLVFLSQPPKKPESEKEAEEEADTSTEETSAEP